MPKPSAETQYLKAAKIPFTRYSDAKKAWDYTIVTIELGCAITEPRFEEAKKWLISLGFKQGKRSTYRFRKRQPKRRVKEAIRAKFFAHGLAIAKQIDAGGFPNELGVRTHAEEH